MFNRTLYALILVLPFTGWFGAGPVSAENIHHHSKYVGQEQRSIKSLSDADIAELQRGGGWGMAKAAELNGVPGPIHLLELKDEIPLSDEQVSVITQLYHQMKSEAIESGTLLIELEAALDRQFRNGTVDETVLRASLEAIADVRMRLRFTHLSAHLQTPHILTPDQIAKYASLRGYGKTNPCDNIPVGHSAAMWRKHNGCN
tara:strand:+ start:101 stop:706 length:606 start_codon:yes stop_codon:yes gene_type:complete